MGLYLRLSINSQINIYKLFAAFFVLSTVVYLMETLICNQMKPNRAMKRMC